MCKIKNDHADVLISNIYDRNAYVTHLVILVSSFQIGPQRVYKGFFQTLNNFLLADRLDKFFYRMHSRYGKLANIKSGQATREYTKREKFIISTFSYLNKQIVRVPSGQSSKGKEGMPNRVGNWLLI